MPSMDFHGGIESPVINNYASLKAHKVLPRRKIHMSNGTDFWKAKHIESKEPQVDRFTNDIQAWIPDPLQPHVDPALRLPLTPPVLVREEARRNLSHRPGSTTPPRYDVNGSKLSPMPDQRSPPTPEKTPPRKPVHHSDLTPPPTLRQPSSRAESFRTARENFDSETEDSPRSPSPSPLITPIHHKRTGLSKSIQLNNVGLGLGLDLTDDDKTPTAETPKVMPESWEYSESDGSWSHNVNVVKEDPILASGSVPMPRIAISNQSPVEDEVALMVSPTLPPSDIFGNSLGRGPSLRERVELNKCSPASASTEHFAEQIQWPLDHDKTDIDAKVRQVDNRRFSQMSGTSTVIEAMVVDTRPLRRQTLRHTSKNISLRTASSEASRSNRSSLVSSEPRHRLIHRNTKITERGNGSSLTSNSTPSVSSEQVRSRKPAIPVAVIPQRRSSLKSSAPSSKRQSRNISDLGAQEQSGRPTTAPDGSTGYFDLTPRKHRTMSTPLELLTPSKPAERKHPAPPPAIPARSSSLSAPTSRNASRTASFTSTVLHTQAAPPFPHESPLQHPTVEFAPRTVSPIESTPLRTTEEEWHGLRPRSTLVTPFSMTSMNSSTPGTLEVSEATAINIYPHNNKSVLVVQQTGRGAPEEPDMSAFLADNNESSILPRQTQAPTMDIPTRTFDSPLRYPRAPPRPPAFLVIPPTPADHTPPIEPHRDLNHGNTDPKPSNSGRFSAVRRALSARRYSDSFTAPFTRSLSLSKRTTPILAQRPSTSDKPSQTLSAFWRPRGFWDDFSDSDSDFGNDGFVSNTLGLPQKRVIPGPAAIARRLGSLKLKRPTQNTVNDTNGGKSKRRGFRRRKSTESVRSYKFMYKDEGVEGAEGTGLGQANGRGTGVPRLGYQVQFVGFKSLREGYEKRKVRREEDRRERERRRLRESIRPVNLREEGFVY
ncbi:hypothetical protein MMC30_008251 [Trapelia coarctata]|nr:hypothetical protein [Trapelia coarctata]